jgi:protein SCO1/2
VSGYEMRKNQKILTTILWSVLVLTMLGVVGMGMFRRDDGEPAAQYIKVDSDAPQEQGLPVLFDTPHFAMTDQNAKPFDSDQLKGNVWVAAFVFTNCPGVCPMMTQRMAKLQSTVPSKDVKLVSISVDPERDTPEVLKQYAQRFKADESRWHFLTGEKSAMLEAAKGLKLSVTSAEGDKPITHAETFLLVDRQGRVRGIYDSKDEQELNQLTRDAELLAK